MNSFYTASPYRNYIVNCNETGVVSMDLDPPSHDVRLGTDVRQFFTRSSPATMAKCDGRYTIFAPIHEKSFLVAINAYNHMHVNKLSYKKIRSNNPLNECVYKLWF